MKKRLLICGVISCAGAAYVAGACGALIFFLAEKGSAAFLRRYAAL